MFKNAKYVVQRDVKNVKNNKLKFIFYECDICGSNRRENIKKYTIKFVF